MSVIINPGSRIAADQTSEGWTNTYAGALAQAREWHDHMRRDGFGHDVELIEPADREPSEGRWTFGFRHLVTGVVVELWTHGIDDIDAYQQRHIFAPRVYWNGSSCSNPELEHWKADGYFQTFREQT